MTKIGFIDDDISLIEDYKTRLKRGGIELFFVEDCRSMQDVVKWILQYEIKCMLVDYKLTNLYDFDGTKLVAFINSELPDLPCIVLTNYCNDGIKENFVIQNLFVEREILEAESSSPEFKEFICTLEQAVKVFDNRLKAHLSDFEELMLKKKSNTICSFEEERFLELFRILRAYGEVDDLPIELLTTNASQKMEQILKSLDNLITKNNF